MAVADEIPYYHIIQRPRRLHHTRRAFSMSSALPGFVLIGAVCFNAILSIINGHFVTLARAHVVLAEVAVYAGALAIILFRADRKMWPWFLLTLFIVLVGLLTSLGSGVLNAKYIRDVLAIPVFIMLGMTYRSKTFLQPFSILHTIVFLVAVLEVVSPDAYGELFRVLNYYVNTRDFTADSFWNTESTLFVSATRPGARSSASLTGTVCPRSSWSRFARQLLRRCRNPYRRLLARNEYRNKSLFYRFDTLSSRRVRREACVRLHCSRSFCADFSS